MIDIKKIPSMLCSDLITDVQDVAGKTCVITPMTYPNGDSINIYFDRSHGDVFASDEGSTKDNLAQRGVKFTREKVDFIKTVCRIRGTSFTMRKITKIVKPKSLTDDVFSFCQSITDISNLHYHVHSLERSHFHDAVDSLVRRKIEPVRDVERLWTNPDIDPKGSFPVDYRIAAGKDSRYLFYVASSSKALLVTAVSHFLLSHNIRVPTLTIVDEKAGIKGRQIDRLQLGSTKLIYGVKGNERKIANFALRAAA